MTGLSSESSSAEHSESSSGVPDHETNSPNMESQKSVEVSVIITNVN